MISGNTLTIRARAESSPSRQSNAGRRRGASGLRKGFALLTLVSAPATALLFAANCSLRPCACSSDDFVFQISSTCFKRSSRGCELYGYRFCAIVLDFRSWRTLIVRVSMPSAFMSPPASATAVSPKQDAAAGGCAPRLPRSGPRRGAGCPPSGRQAHSATGAARYTRRAARSVHSADDGDDRAKRCGVAAELRRLLGQA